MACLCGSANCRGVIGGTQETAVLAPPVVVPEYEDDPEPIMVSGVKATPTLERLLDRIVGVGSHAGLTSGERSL